MRVYTTKIIKALNVLIKNNGSQLAWTAITKGKKIDKKAARNMYKHLREIEDPAYRLDKFWRAQPDFKEYNFQDLKEWCGLALEDSQKLNLGFDIEKKFKPRQVRHFIRLLRRYGQKELDKDPLITIDTIHSVKVEKRIM